MKVTRNGRRGAQPLPDELKRDNTVATNLTVSEFEQLYARADAELLSVSEVLRRGMYLYFQQPLPVPSHPLHTQPAQPVSHA